MRNMIAGFLALFCWNFSLAQPANDDCSGAIEIQTVAFGAACTGDQLVQASTANATASPFAPACAGSSADDDVWYHFTATSPNVVIRIAQGSNIPSGSTGFALAVYDGSCPDNNTAFYCVGSFGFNSGHQVVNGLTPGNTIYIRFWSPGTSTRIQFQFCVQNLPAPPANDECSGAISLAVQPFGQSCTNPTLVNTAGATASAIPPNACGGNDNNDDVWMKFEATSTQHIFRYANLTPLLGSVNYIGLSIYNAGTPDVAVCPTENNALACDVSVGFNGGYRLVGDFVPGNIYYIRVWTTGQQNFGSFNFCVQEVPEAPANDECSGAISLAVQPFGQSCTNPTLVNTAGATASAIPPNACGGNDNNDDVWMKFEATSTQHIFRYANLTPLLGSVNYIGLSIYNAGTPDVAVCPTENNALACDVSVGFNGGYRLIGGFVPGNIYYIRVWTTGQQNFGSFNFCVQEVSEVPANDECSGAISLAVQPFGQSCTNPTLVNTSGATRSVIPPNACGNQDNNDDVWLKFEATSTQHIFRYANLTPLLGSVNYIGLSIYNAGTPDVAVCPTENNALACDVSVGFNGGYRLVGGFVPGNIYYIRVWTTGQQNFGSFNFCVQEVPEVPANDECSGAISLAVQPFGQSCTNPTLVNTSGATRSVIPPNACGNQDNNDDVWLKFEATSTQHIFRYANLTPLLGSVNYIGLSIYNAGTPDVAVCPTENNALACDVSVGFNGGYRLIGGFVPGNIYYIRVWTTGQQNFSSFNFCVQEVPAAPANDECVNAQWVTLQPTDPQCREEILVNTAGATTSANKASCMPANNTEDDVWFRFTATTPNIRLIYSNIQALLGSVNYIGYAFYKENCPAGNTSFVCSNTLGFNGGRAIISGLEKGTNYYLRVWTTGNENFSAFRLCLQEIEAPENDECTNATALITGQGFCTSAEVGQLFDATTSAGFNTAPSCRPGGRTEDVWYTATIPATGNLIVQTSPAVATISDLVMVAYTGNCGSLTPIACDDNGNPEPSPASSHARIVMENRTPGEVITFRVVAATEANKGRFSICAFDTTSTVLPLIAPEGDCTPAVNTWHISDTAANGYRWLPFFDANGKIIAEVYANSPVSDTLQVQLFVNQSDNIRENSSKPYGDRNLRINNTKGSFNGRIRWYLLSDEISLLRQADATLSGISNLEVVSDTTACSNLLVNRVYSYQKTYANYPDGYYLQITPTRTGHFFNQSACGPLITWTGTKSSDWHDPANWNCGGVPWVNSTARIPAGTPHQPVIGLPVTVKAMQVQPNASVTVLPGIPVVLNGE